MILETGVHELMTQLIENTGNIWKNSHELTTHFNQQLKDREKDLLVRYMYELRNSYTN
jgi:hypothetical protein